MHVEHIKEQKFSGSFFPWEKKIKKTQHCSSGSLPSASILSKIKLTERRQILGSCFHKTECFSGTSNLKLPLFLLLVCMYMCVFFFLLPVLNNKIRPKKKKKNYYLHKMKVSVTQSCLTLCNPMNPSVHGILQWSGLPFPLLICSILKFQSTISVFNLYFSYLSYIFQKVLQIKYECH